MALNELKGFGSIRFFIGTLADWNASSKILAVNEFAIVTDRPGSFKQGQAIASLQSSGPTFANLPWFTPDGAPSIVPIVYSSTTGIVAHPGGGQTNAVQLTTEFNEVVTVATSGDSVKLPSAVAGLAITVKNNGAEALAVFPFLGDSINTLAVNASVYLSPGTSKTFRAQDATIWQETAGPVAVNRIPAAINASATATAAQVGTGAITSTSAAATGITLPTATLLGAYLGVSQGSSFDFIVDNSVGANIVTVIVGAGITKVGIGLLTIPVGEVAIFRLYFTSTTTAVLNRISADEALTVAAMTDNSGGVSGGNTIAVLVDAGGTAAGAPTTASVANALATISAKQNAILTSLKAAGIML